MHDRLVSTGASGGWHVVEEMRQVRSRPYEVQHLPGTDDTRSKQIRIVAEDPGSEILTGLFHALGKRCERASSNGSWVRYVHDMYASPALQHSLCTTQLQLDANRLCAPCNVGLSPRSIQLQLTPRSAYRQGVGCTDSVPCQKVWFSYHAMPSGDPSSKWNEWQVSMVWAGLS